MWRLQDDISGHIHRLAQLSSSGFTTAILTTHFIPYAIDRGFAPSTAATALGVMNGLNVIGGLVVGALAGRSGGCPEILSEGCP